MFPYLSPTFPVRPEPVEGQNGLLTVSGFDWSVLTTLRYVQALRSRFGPPAQPERYELTPTRSVHALLHARRPY